jgi:elongation factor G
MPIEAGKIRNVAVVGHRGTGKTSLVEALLFQAGKTNRLGQVEAGTTVSDWDDDEHKRQMSLAASLCNCEWEGRKLNLIDTPGDSGFQADTVAALRVVEGAIVVVSGVMGVEVNTSRVWNRAEELGLSRVVYVNMLDRERADFFRVLSALQEQLSDRCIAIQLPIGAEHELNGVVDLLHNRAYLDPDGAREGDPVDVPEEMKAQVEEYRTKLLDAVVETDEALMEQYLAGEEIPDADIASALKNAVTRDEIYPVSCGVATRNLGSHELLDLLVEGFPSPAKKGSPIETDASVAAFVFKTVADPFAGRISIFRVYAGEVKPDTTLVNHRDHSKERLGALMTLEGKEHEKADGFGSGDIGAVAKLKDVQTGDVLVDAEHDLDPPPIGFPEPVMSFAVTAKTKGDEDKVAQALRRLSEEDPTLRLSRDPQTGEELLSGMSQMHVEVAVERARRRFGVEMELHQPRVPYVETIKGKARAHGRYKKQTGGRGQFGDCHIEIEPLDAGDVDLEFVDQIKGGVIPSGFIPAVEKGVRDAMAHGPIAGYPVKGVRVRLVDGSYHTVDSSEQAFRTAGSLAMKDALAQAGAVLLEPIMLVTLSVPEESVGDVIGDLNSRRGRPLGMEPKGHMTEIQAEVPMSEMLSYAPDLRAITGGRADYTMDLARYEEVPSHLAQQVVSAAKTESEAVSA